MRKLRPCSFGNERDTGEQAKQKSKNQKIKTFSKVEIFSEVEIFLGD